MVDALGVCGYEGAFRKVCEIALTVLRSRRGALMSVLETFLYDPLVEWVKTSRAAVSPSPPLSTGGTETSHPAAKGKAPLIYFLPLRCMYYTVQYYIVVYIVYFSVVYCTLFCCTVVYICSSLCLVYAFFHVQKHRADIDSRLQGIVVGVGAAPSLPLSVEGQANQLILEATSLG